MINEVGVEPLYCYCLFRLHTFDQTILFYFKVLYRMLKLLDNVSKCETKSGEFLGSGLCATNIKFAGALTCA